MDNERYWRACDRLSIFQATFLIMGYDPENTTYWQIQKSKKQEFPAGYQPLQTVLVEALCSGRIEGKKSFDDQYYHDGCTDEESYIDVDNTKIDVLSLKKYLKEKKITDNFFFYEGEASEEYLDPEHGKYASKLAGAVKAWEAINSNPQLLKNKTPKQAVKKWLEENANQFGLKKGDGSLNNDAIENICKICNWKPEGGVAKTGTRPQLTKTHVPHKKTFKLKAFNAPEPNLPSLADMDDEIPF